LYGALLQPLDLDDTLICTGGGEERSQVKNRKTSDFSVKVVPNPAKDRFAIQATGVAADALMHLQIADLNGKILKDVRVRNGEVLAYTFAPGLYVCRVLAGDAPARVVKFIVVP
ncbi:MAG: T9SS type A sorting domain-containing protein, partial [Saprospiraceae bacterium]|nr:T9SS type A sorting domain-containing protein [Saprospiraceae bacterium]